MTAKTNEAVLNGQLAAALQGKHPDWQVAAERTGVLRDSQGKRPDILLTGSAAPLVLETEFSPAPGVEKDAQSRLGKVLKDTGQSIHQVIAVRLPAELARKSQAELPEHLAAARYKCCLWTGEEDPASWERWPAEGWLKVDLDGLAGMLEHTGASSKQVTAALKVLENGVRAAAGRIRQEPEATNERIAATLYQVDGEQTSRMAMAILANALTFQEMIAEQDLGDRGGGGGEGSCTTHRGTMRAHRELSERRSYPGVGAYPGEDQLLADL